MTGWTTFLSAFQKLWSGSTGISDFRSGLNRDFEGKSFGFTHGFTLDAHSTAALEIYACDETHKIVGGQMTTHCVGGAEGIMVFDIEGQV